MIPARPVSPRRRRLRITAVLLGGLAAAAIGIGTWLALQNRPPPYHPDEHNADITASLAQGLPPDAPRPLFTDVTRPAGLGAFRNFAGHRTSQLPEDMGPGLAWGDFDNDGDDDLFLVSAGGALDLPPDQLLPCELHENAGDGSFRKVAGFPELRLRGMGAAWGDSDGDGWLDIVVAGYDALHLLHNEGGTGRFTADTRLPNPPGFWSAAVWGDYDNDRALDLYVCNYVQYRIDEADRTRFSDQIGTAVPFTLNPASYAPGLNLLFHNRGDGTFEEVAAQLNVQSSAGRSLGALWQDFDHDGWLDLYVANDISDNILYRNTGGRFQDVSHPAYVADYRSAMGLAAGDFDRDGDDDLFVTHWVAQENALYENLWANFNLPRPGLRTGQTGTDPAPIESRSQPLRFMDVADSKGVGQMSLPFVGWGTEFVDFDSDGWLDLLVANGNTLEEDGPPPRRLKAQEPFVLWNQRGEFFHNLAPLNPTLAQPHVGRGLAVADFDLDGDPDVAIAQLGEGVQLLRNDMPQGNRLVLRLKSRNRAGQPNGFGDGARVIANVGGTLLHRSVTSVSYLSQSSRALHFGLGRATRVDRLEVRWLGGRTNMFDNLEANIAWEIVEGENEPRRLAIPAGASSATRPPARASPADERARLVAFWGKQRAAMNALKVERDFAGAAALFREALTLNPDHEDSRYYLGHCLAGLGDVNGALDQLRELTRINPRSHRAWQQWGTLRARFAQSDADLAAAAESLQRAHSLNPEETGALLVAGEISLLRGDSARARQQFEDACRTNPRAAGGFFLRGYLAWKHQGTEAARRLLEETRTALGADWQPTGSTSEGDVKRKQHAEQTPLSRFWETWDGQPDPAAAYAALDEFLASRPR